MASGRLYRAVHRGQESPATDTSRFNVALWWVKRDARLDDNPTLAAALVSSRYVIPIAIDEPDVWNSPECSELHRASWLGALDALRKNLEMRGSLLVFLAMPAVDALQFMLAKTCVSAVFSHEEIGSESTYRRDRQVRSLLSEIGIPWIETPQSGVIRGPHSRNVRGKTWLERVASTPLGIPEKVTLPPDLASRLQNRGGYLPGTVGTVTERNGRRTLRTFLDTRGQRYSGGISSPNTAFERGSRLSEHLAWGTLSLRRVYFESTRRLKSLEGATTSEAQLWRRSLRAFQARLHWRDHFIQRLESEPEMEFFALNPAYQAFPYEDRADLLQAWLSGTTGVPLVDACMRCLSTTGFLNFRMRAMVVSYACHVLQLSWKTIMHPLARLFIDYEPGIHISQLQMQAGVVGINTIRIYNPKKQLLDYDREMVFVKRWLPELRIRSGNEILDHEHNPLSDYPAPVVCYAQRVQQTKLRLYSLRAKSETKAAAQLVLIKHGSRRKAAEGGFKKPSSSGQLSFKF